MPSTQETINDIYHKITGLDARINAGGGGAGNHNLLSATHPDTDPSSPPARGSLIRASAGNEWQEYAIGAAGRYLRSDGVDPSWATIPDEDVILDILGAATYDNLHEYINNVQSACRISGGAISDSGGGEIDVAAGKGILKTTDSEIGANVQFDWSAETNIALANNETTWVGIQYNPGPQVKTDPDLSNFNFHTDFVLGRVYRSGATLYILNAGSYYSNFQHRVCYRIFEVDHFRRATGGIIADEGNLDFSISQGAWYCGTTKYTTAIFDCSGADTFTYWYRDGGGGWTVLAAQADINNLNYDDGVPPLGALGVGRYGVHWVYLAHDGSVHVQYGQGNYKHFEAEAAEVPDGPDFFSENCVLVGKIIVGQGDATLTDVLSSFETIFIGQAASIHNDLGGLQGGQADEYYHLTATEHGYISGVNAQSLLTTASPSFVNITDTGVEATNLAAGTTGQRPGGIVGDIRYNSTLGAFEIYTGVWENILSSGDVGIADNDILSVDGAPVANDYAKFTASGLLGRSYDEVLADLSGEALAAFDWNAQDLYNIGGITAWGNVEILREAISASCTLKVWSSGAGWHASTLRFFRGRGTQAVPVAILNNDSMCSMPIVGQYDGANTYEGGKTLWQAAENWDAANRGITYKIQGTNLGAVALSDWLTIEDGDAIFAGDIWVSGASAAIRNSSDVDTLALGSSTTPLKGAAITLYSAGIGALKGNMYLDFGDYTAAAPAAASLNIRSLDNGAAPTMIKVDAQGVHMVLRSGANQGAAGAVVGELWHDTTDDTVKMGV